MIQTKMMNRDHHQGQSDPGVDFLPGTELTLMKVLMVMSPTLSVLCVTRGSHKIVMDLTTYFGSTVRSVMFGAILFVLLEKMQ